MIGAILGDIVGAPYEFDNCKSKVFPLFDPDALYTDDTVMTVAVADALLEWNGKDIDAFKEFLVDKMHAWGKMIPDAGYGGRFLTWVLGDSRLPYGSYGNGSAMRVSPVAWYADTLEETKALATASAEVTHNHPEGVKGAVAVAGAIFLARVGKNKEAIRAFLSDYYRLNFTLDEIRAEYDFDETCQGSVPQALVAFLEGDSFEDVIRTAVSVGGDSDTIAAIAGSIAEAYYGIPEAMAETAFSYLDAPVSKVVTAFCRRFVIPKNKKGCVDKF